MTRKCFCFLVLFPGRTGDAMFWKHVLLQLFHLKTIMPSPPPRNYCRPLKKGSWWASSSLSTHHDLTLLPFVGVLAVRGFLLENDTSLDIPNPPVIPCLGGGNSNIWWWFQENYNTPHFPHLQAIPRNRQLWIRNPIKKAGFSERFLRCVPKVCWNNLRKIPTVSTVGVWSRPQKLAFQVWRCVWEPTKTKVFGLDV